MDFQALRKEYERSGIDEVGLPADPLELFHHWFNTATENCPGGWCEPNAMSLATSDSQGNVSARVVLLKGITETGIRFFTNYDSEKGQQLAINPRAAVVFHWPYLGRQIRLSGAVARTSPKISESYFHSRPRGSQIGAAASHQSRPIDSHAVLVQAANKLAEKWLDQPIPRPDNWGGFELTIAKAEFWQGRLDRLHDRIVYQIDAAANAWRRTRLSP